MFKNKMLKPENMTCSLVSVVLELLPVPLEYFTGGKERGQNNE